MKKAIKLFAFIGLIMATVTASAQQPKKPRPSPADTVKGTLKGGTAVEIAYSQPSIKGRTIGTDIAPYGKWWRTGANEVTTVEFSKDVKLEGKMLPAGKYALYTIPNLNEWKIIFNKDIKSWGTNYKPENNVLEVTVKPAAAPQFTEQLKFMIDPAGKIGFTWGDKLVAFKVK